MGRRFWSFEDQIEYIKQLSRRVRKSIECRGMLHDCQVALRACLRFLVITFKCCFSCFLHFVQLSGADKDHVESWIFTRAVFLPKE